jgi:hypothetical protein
MPADEQQFVHLSGNPGKPLGFSLNWSARITSEFFAQVGRIQCAVQCTAACCLTCLQTRHGVRFCWLTSRIDDRAMLRRLPGCLFLAGATGMQQMLLRHRCSSNCSTCYCCVHGTSHAISALVIECLFGKRRLLTFASGSPLVETCCVS